MKIKIHFKPSANAFKKISIMNGRKKFNEKKSVRVKLLLELLLTLPYTFFHPEVVLLNGGEKAEMCADGGQSNQDERKHIHIY